MAIDEGRERILGRVSVARQEELDATGNRANRRASPGYRGSRSAEITPMAERRSITQSLPGLVSDLP